MEKTVKLVKKPLTIEQIEKREKVFSTIKLVVLYLILTISAVVVLIPFFWMISSSMKTEFELTQTFKVLPKEMMPFDWFHRHFIQVLNQIQFGTLLKNTTIVGMISTAGTLVTTVLAAYAFAKLNFKGRDFIFMLILATMMIPGEMMTITNFITVSDLRWLDTYKALTIPFMTSTFYVFFLRQTIKQIPNQLYQAAKIDGVSDFKFLMRIVIPVAKPTLITITILSMIGSWNAYIWPNLVTTKGSMRLISNGIRVALTDSEGKIAAGIRMAASTIITIPLLVVFLLLKKYIIKGVSRSGIKG